jgi:hypothetical protein
MSVRSATIILFSRYLGLLEGQSASCDEHAVPEGTSMAHLAWMCRTCIDSSSDWPDDKLSRWLGFVQGVMSGRGLLRVAAEREASRPLFHAAYEAAGVAKPGSVERPAD